MTRGTGITLPGPPLSKLASRKGKDKKGKEKEKRSDQTLPDDMHFSSKQLVTLFLKPKFSVRTVVLCKSLMMTDSLFSVENARTAYAPS